MKTAVSDRVSENASVRSKSRPGEGPAVEGPEYVRFLTQIPVEYNDGSAVRPSGRVSGVLRTVRENGCRAALEHSSITAWQARPTWVLSPDVLNALGSHSDVNVSVDVGRAAKMPDKGWAFHSPNIPDLVAVKIFLLIESHVQLVETSTAL